MLIFFFLNDRAPPEIYPLSLHDALPIYGGLPPLPPGPPRPHAAGGGPGSRALRALPDHTGELPAQVLARHHGRSEEHTSELQSRQYLVCRLLLEKKKTYSSSL